MLRFFTYTAIGFLAILLGTSLSVTRAVADNYRTEATRTMTGDSTADWTTESQHWQNNYTSRPYYRDQTDYSTYEPAYRHGFNMYNQFNGRPYNELNESALHESWNRNYGETGMRWEDARGPVQDSYNRLYDNTGAGASDQ